MTIRSAVLISSKTSQCRFSPPTRERPLRALAQLGEGSEEDQPLYTIEKPDLIQAESNLIGAATTFELTNKELVRAKNLYTSE